jgi:hypothetical protein
MSRNLRLIVIDASLVLALIFSLVPQYWPAVEIYSRYGAIACAVIAVCAYLFLGGTRCEINKEKKKTSKTPNFEDVIDPKLNALWAEAVILRKYLDDLQSELLEHKLTSKQSGTPRFEAAFRIASLQADETVTIGPLAFELRGNGAKILSSKKGGHQKFPRSSTPPYLEGGEIRRHLLVN